GVEIEEDLADKFRRRVAARSLESKVSVVHGDLRNLDLSDATVVVMYLLPEAMADIAQSHLLPLLRRGGPHEQQQQRQRPERTPPTDPPPPLSLSGDSGTKNSDTCGSSSRSRGVQANLCRARVGAGEGVGVVVGEGEREGGELRPCRIVCNTWGIPGATAVREAGVGLHGGVKLRLFTHASLAEGA
ncbi:unnamed protein product, partial [Hapterophycus canaliculatus]